MSLLTGKQKEVLNNSILNYLQPLVPEGTLIEVQKSLHIDQITDDNDLLPKKWNAILRLQKKILDLESQLSQLSHVNSTNLSFFATTNQELTKLNWAPTKTKKTLNHDSSITSLVIHPNLPQLIAGSSNGSFTIWNLLDLVQPITTVKAHTKSINAMDISPEKLPMFDNAHVLVTCGSDLYIKIWDLKTFKLLRTFTGHEHVVSSIVFQGDDKIFTCSRDRSIKYWDLKLGWCLKSFIGHSDWVRSLDIINNEFILSGSNDQSIRLSHGESGTGLGLMIHNQVVEAVKFIPRIGNKYVDKLNDVVEINKDDLEIYEKLGYKYAVSGGRDDAIHIWLLPLPILRPHNHPLPSSNPHGILIRTLVGHKSWVKDLQLHPNGRILISCSDDKSVKFWDLETGDCVKTLEGHDGFVNTIAWAPSIYENKKEAEEKLEDEAYINENMRCIFASGSTDQTVKVWD